MYVLKITFVLVCSGRSTFASDYPCESRWSWILSFAVGYLQVNSMLKVCSLDYLHVRYNAIGPQF
jgi:hypothetical protein